MSNNLFDILNNKINQQVSAAAAKVKKHQGQGAALTSDGMSFGEIHNKHAALAFANQQGQGGQATHTAFSDSPNFAEGLIPNTSADVSQSVTNLAEKMNLSFGSSVRPVLSTAAMSDVLEPVPENTAGEVHNGDLFQDMKIRPIEDIDITLPGSWRIGQVIREWRERQGQPREQPIEPAEGSEKPPYQQITEADANDVEGAKSVENLLNGAHDTLLGTFQNAMNFINNTDDFNQIMRVLNNLLMMASMFSDEVSRIGDINVSQESLDKIHTLIEAVKEFVDSAKRMIAEGKNDEGRTINPETEPTLPLEPTVPIENLEQERLEREAQTKELVRKAFAMVDNPDAAAELLRQAYEMSPDTLVNTLEQVMEEIIQRLQIPPLPNGNVSTFAVASTQGATRPVENGDSNTNTSWLAHVGDAEIVTEATGIISLILITAGAIIGKKSATAGFVFSLISLGQWILGNLTGDTPQNPPHDPIQNPPSGPIQKEPKQPPSSGKGGKGGGHGGGGGGGSR